MRVYLTGGAGFIGRATVRRLITHGGSVVAVVREPDRAAGLADLGVEVVSGDLSSLEGMVGRMRGTDVVIHLAGSYRIGIARSERPAMFDANVGATKRVLDAAIAAGVPRIVHVSTVNVFGDTKGRIVDEGYRRDLHHGFVSYYDETKYLAHVAAVERMRAGAPIVIAMPASVYGRGDHSGTGEQLQAAFEGTARYIALGDLGISPVHVDDVAAGIVAAAEVGRVGESYILAGKNMRLRDAVEVAARAGGRRPPRLEIPARLLRAMARLGPLGDALGSSANLSEVVSAADGVTYWASSAKASLKLGFAPREIEAGMRDAFGGR
ncbi:MAG: NAD-dependent epimerase/dehydratase family protein [Chloroflexi bacterium]|nr:NAD-dependent epimerase/dehydratase family protein [Chloroflexota bacterium]